MNFEKTTAGVIQAIGPVVKIGARDVLKVQHAACNTERRRARINIHAQTGDRLHEMIIALDRDTYIRPHRHPNKSESMHLIRGRADVIIFDDGGEIFDIIRLSSGHGGGVFYYRLSSPLFHTIIVQSKILVIHEVTNGPFVAGETSFADFAPGETDLESVSEFMKKLKLRAKVFMESK